MLDLTFLNFTDCEVAPNLWHKIGNSKIIPEVFKIDGVNSCLYLMAHLDFKGNVKCHWKCLIVLKEIASVN